MNTIRHLTEDQIEERHAPCMALMFEADADACTETSTHIAETMSLVAAADA
jgi:hypothetical protein